MSRAIKSAQRSAVPEISPKKPGVEKVPNLFDASIVGGPLEAVHFITSMLESSTEYSILGKDLEGKILMWNEGARRIYGYEPAEEVGKVNSSILHVPEDVKAGKPRHALDAALGAEWNPTTGGACLSSFSLQFPMKTFEWAQSGRLAPGKQM